MQRCILMDTACAAKIPPHGRTMKKARVSGLAG